MDKNDLRMGYFLVFKSEDKSIFSKGIVKTQLGEGFSDEDAQYTHVEVSGGGSFSVAVTPFTRIKVVDIFNKYKGRYIKVMKYKDKDYQNRTRYKVAFWAASNCNLLYDFWGILKFKLKFIRNQKRLYFCSENALFALQKEHVEALNNLDPAKCFPAHFLDTNWFDLVFEGRVPA